MKNLKTIGIFILILALLINIIETAYFGFNLKPQSHQEEQWDSVCYLLLEISIVFIFISSLKSNKNDN